ncbi:hypothetical protein LUZ60_001614 [Juncus effusus]|nr:hypothetical protein LUZ60_001614 [Juncus effusus]
MEKLILCIVSIFCMLILVCGNFYQDVDIIWGADGRARILGDGNTLQLSLDQSSGSGFQSKNDFLYGKIDIQIKLVPGNSAGTVATFYVRSQEAKHDEIDFEFLGNTSGNPYTVSTNIFTQAIGAREMQFKLWFDPTKNFHTYTIIWSPHHVIFLIDGLPLRVFKNFESKGVMFPKSQALRMYATLWNGEDWATQGGRIKTDWSQAPFVAMYRYYNADICHWRSGKPNCHRKPWWNQQVDQIKMKQIQNNYMVYNYCDDVKRFPLGLPLECKLR